MIKTDLQGYRKNFIKFLCAFMVVFPWITYLNLSKLSEAENSVFVGYDGVSIDFFIHQKSVVLIWIAVLCILWFVGERFLPQKVDNNVPLLKGQNKWLFLLSGVFAIGTVLSTVFSQYRENALEGSPTVGEGLWALLGYIVLVYAFYNYFANSYAFEMAKKAIVVLSGITIVLTMVEWFYKPLLEIGLVQALVAPAKYQGIVSSMEASVFKSSISLTFYNPGYFGGFVCLLIPFVVGFFLQAKEIKERVLHAVLMIGLLFGVVVANTTTSLYIAILEIVLLVVLHMISKSSEKTASKNPKPTVKILNAKNLLHSLLLIILAVVAIAISGIITGNSIFGIFSNANSASNKVVEERFEIEDVQLDGNRVILTGKEECLVIRYEDAQLKFFGGNGEALTPIYRENDVAFVEPAYENVTVAIRSMGEGDSNVHLILQVDAGYQSTIDFYLLQTGVFAGVGQNGTVLTDIGDAGTPEALKSFYGKFTGRGYAWVNSLPILKETWLIGKGPGNFAYYFKQFDYAGLLDTHKSIRQIIDKPHSAYIQYATELGWPAMIAFFGIFVGALVKAARCFIKNKKRAIENPIYIGAFVAVIGFLICSLINDSMITVTPVACMIVGLLLASCYEE